MMMMRWRGRVLARRIWARSLHLDAATSQCLTHHQHTTLALASKVYITHKYIIPKQNGKWHWHSSQMSILLSLSAFKY